jgi:hypothetical protein
MVEQECVHLLLSRNQLLSPIKMKSQMMTMIITISMMMQAAKETIS